MKYLYLMFHYLLKLICFAMENHDKPLVNSMGTPWVFLGLPIPISVKTHTLHMGMGLQQVSCVLLFLDEISLLDVSLFAQIDAALCFTMENHDKPLVNNTGTPWVFLGLPVPIPVKTRTLHMGMGLQWVS
jgi:hypothetical protein